MHSIAYGGVGGRFGDGGVAVEGWGAGGFEDETGGDAADSGGAAGIGECGEAIAGEGGGCEVARSVWRDGGDCGAAGGACGVGGDAGGDKRVALQRRSTLGRQCGNEGAGHEGGKGEYCAGRSKLASSRLRSFFLSDAHEEAEEAAGGGGDVGHGCGF